MDPETFAQATLIVYALVAVAVICGQVIMWPDGWKAWVLFVTSRLYLRCCFHWRAEGEGFFPESGPAIIVANHSSPLDPMFVMIRSRRVIGFMMAREYYELPVIHWISVAMESIPVERNGKDLQPTRDALKRLKSGKLLGVFPEGRLNRESKLLAGNPGIAWLALRSKAPVYPVYIHNAPGGDSMVSPFYTFDRVKVTFGAPVDLSKYYNGSANQAALQEVTDLLMSHIARLGNVEYTPISSNRDRLPTKTTKPHFPRLSGDVAER